MSKNKTKQPQPRQPVAHTGNSSIIIPYPLLWLAVAVIVVYFPSFSLGVTDLDDAIFIRNFSAYNADLHNLVTSFQRGLFDATHDPYYRPLFLDSMILNFHMSDEGQNIFLYHAINIVFHLITVGLLYRLLRKLNIKEIHAFLLALVFAVLPVLSQAVAWIPGRNDTMLAIFVLAFFIFCIDYANTGKLKHLLLSALFLLLAFFTKETAAFALPAAFILLVLVLQKNWKEKVLLAQYGVWAVCFAIWFVARSVAATASSGIGTAGAFADLLHRLPVVIQYLGKIFLPFNLSVFPEQNDTVYYYGIIALILLTAVVALYKQRNMRVIAAGTLIFLLFLAPALLVPHELNKQTFEHRLYLPVIGILLILSQSVLMRNKLSDKQLLMAYGAVCIGFAAINIQHQKSFSDPLSFWTQAVETSPNSSYANMMLAARLGNDQFDRSCALFRKAYGINPKEKYLNFYYGVMLQRKDSVLQSEPYLLAEKKISDYYECDFYLARVAIEKKDLNGAIACLERYLTHDAESKTANNNLLLLYLQTQQKDKAIAQVRRMQQQNMDVPPQVLQQLGLH